MLNYVHCTRFKVVKHRILTSADVGPKFNPNFIRNRITRVNLEIYDQGFQVILISIYSKTLLLYNPPTLLAQNHPFLKKIADYRTIAEWLNPDKLANQTSVRRKVCFDFPSQSK